MVSIKQNTIYNTILSFLKVLFPLITAPYVSRVLGVTNIGVINFATSYAAYFVLFATLGIHRYGIRAIAEKGEDVEARNKTFSELFWLILLSSIIVSVVYLISIYTIDKLYNERLYLLIVGCTVLTASFNIEWYFSGRQNFKLITIRSLIIRTISIISLFIFVKTEKDIVQYIIIYTGAVIINQFWNWSYFFRKDSGSIKFTQLKFKHHIKPLFMLFAVAISVSIYTILDTIMLGFISTFNEVGYYTQAAKITKTIIPIVTAMGTVILARVAFLKNTNDIEQIKKTVSNSFNYMLTLAIPFMIGIFIIAPYFIPLFFGDDFIPSIVLVQILTPLILIIGVSNVFITQLLQPLGHDKLYLRVILLGTVTNFILNIILIERYGAIGSSIASVVGELVIAISAFITSLRILKLNYNIKAILQPIISSLPIIIIYICVKDLSLSEVEKLLIIIPLSIASYIIIMTFVLKNEIANRIFYNIIYKLRLK